MREFAADVCGTVPSSGLLTWRTTRAGDGLLPCSFVSGCTLLVSTTAPLATASWNAFINARRSALVILIGQCRGVAGPRVGGEILRESSFERVERGVSYIFCFSSENYNSDIGTLFIWTLFKNICLGRLEVFHLISDADNFDVRFPFSSSFRLLRGGRTVRTYRKEEVRTDVPSGPTERKKFRRIDVF